jgi:hypothetical protein
MDRDQFFRNTGMAEHERDTMWNQIEREAEGMVSYAHKGAPKGQRFRQSVRDKLPAWAVDVRPV